jgi:hypothetical protein
VFLFAREHDFDHRLIALNLSNKAAVAALANRDVVATVLLSSHLDREGEQVRSIVNLTKVRDRCREGSEHSPLSSE